MACLLLYALYARSPLAIDILRDRGTLFQTSNDGAISNDYQLKVMNKTQQDGSYRLRVVEPVTILLASKASLDVQAGEVVDIPLQLVTRHNNKPTERVVLELCESSTNACVKEATSFLSPTGAIR